MKRWLFHLAAGVLLMLFMVGAVGWVRSYWVKDVIEHTSYSVTPAGHWQEVRHHLYCVRGRVVLTEGKTLRPAPPDTTPPATRLSYLKNDAVWGNRDQQWTRRIGFGYGGEYNSPAKFKPKPGAAAFGANRFAVSWRYAWVPFWFLQLLTALLPAIWLIRWRRRHRFGPGQCRVCGYDLRATPERCPECGTAAAVTA